MPLVFNGNIQLIDKQPLSVTANGTYTAPAGKAYDPVTVNVAGGAAEAQLKGLIDKSATHIDIPDGTASIGTYAFTYCVNLTSVTIPSSVTSIENYAFYNCTSLASISIPSGVTSLSTGIFWNCSSLTSVVIPNSVTSIGQNAFYKCAITEFDVPSGVVDIDAWAFFACSALTRITIPNSVANIGFNTFYQCDNLATIICDFAEGAVSGAPWGAPNATITYLR